MGETVQLAALEPFALAVVYTEDRRPGAKLEARGDAIASLRRDDELYVSHLHRLGTGQHDLSEAIQAVMRQHATIFEASTGRHSRIPTSLVAMIEDANAFYARSMSPERAREIGKLGGMASGVTQRRRDRMPIKDGLRFVNDHKKYPNLIDALAAINRDKRFRRPWNVPYVYRLKKDGYPVKDRQ